MTGIHSVKIFNVLGITRHEKTQKRKGFQIKRFVSQIIGKIIYLLPLNL